ncbi:carboxypeptidase-like regulatory domain-containing protein [Fulvivirgaceae bacterium BMA12]|uniref:Carboxypeptidase-like regulatory domain-containing protein n=1 Tax=Agaribacillus aureus TaxID=3051825 RepID=A0ABT8L5G9_9BACT|nr:carboxypeptidase-like regulatory domain-containing protein [Fulvivirgaceae bacterium BMA12]
MKKYTQITAIIFAFLLFSFTSDQLLPTSLRITVLNELGNVEPGAKVTLYGNSEDYKKEANPVAEGKITDKKGRVTFKGLEPKVYFVNAEKDEKNNYGAGVQTDTLEEGRINKVNIIIE